MSEARAEPSTPAGKAADSSPRQPKATPAVPLADSTESTTVPPAVGVAEGAVQPKGEHGGPKGPEPTRYGDWEKGGRCFDF